MIDFLSAYGLFLAKTLTFVLAFLIIILTLFALSQKNKSEEGSLRITSLNKKWTEVHNQLQQGILSKSAWKKWTKQLKKQEKNNKDTKEDTEEENAARLFIVRFDGDIRASATQALRECISAIIDIAHPRDEVLVVLESAGGFVQHYGLAASQLQRLREHHLFLTVAIDKCAASGGYLMACVANKIIAAPFAIIGSIGVVAQLPNFHRLLKKNNIDFELHTAGQYKRTLTLFGENTEEGREKFQEELEATHQLFKEFITLHRPIVDVAKVANGEHWHATVAKQMNLVDELSTSDDYIHQKIKQRDAFEIAYQEKQTLSEKLFSQFSLTIEKGIDKLIRYTQNNLL